MLEFCSGNNYVSNGSYFVYFISYKLTNTVVYPTFNCLSLFALIGLQLNCLDNTNLFEFISIIIFVVTISDSRLNSAYPYLFIFLSEC